MARNGADRSRPTTVAARHRRIDAGAAGSAERRCSRSLPAEWGRAWRSFDTAGDRRVVLALAMHDYASDARQREQHGRFALARDQQLGNVIGARMGFVVSRLVAVVFTDRLVSVSVLRRMLVIAGEDVRGMLVRREMHGHPRQTQRSGQRQERKAPAQPRARGQVSCASGAVHSARSLARRRPPMHPRIRRRAGAARRRVAATDSGHRCRRRARRRRSGTRCRPIRGAS